MTTVCVLRLVTTFSYVPTYARPLQVDLHIAHAPLTQGEDQSLGVFDVSNFASLCTLFDFLVAHAPALATSVPDAQELIRSQSLPERPARRADGAAVGSVHHDFQARIVTWLRGFRSGTGLRSQRAWLII